MFSPLYIELHKLHSELREMSLSLKKNKNEVAQLMFNNGLKPFRALENDTLAIEIKGRASPSLHLVTFLISDGSMMDKDSALYCAVGVKVPDVANGSLVFGVRVDNRPL